MNDNLWRKVEAALDERVDPFEVPELANELAADPAAAEQLARLLRRLELLGEPHTPAPSARRTGRAAALAAGLVLAAGALTLWRALSSPGDVEAASAGPEPIDTITLTVEHERPSPPKVARVVLEPRRVLTWTLEGETP